MKNFGGTVVFAIVVIAVAGVALWQMQKAKQEENDKPMADLIFSGARSSDVSEFSFAGATTKFKLKKETGHWQVLEPVKDRADDSEVDKVLSDIVDTHAATIETGTGPVDWGKYGFNEPDPLIELKLVSGPTVKVTVGKVRTYDNGFYLRKGDEPKLLNVTSGFEHIHNTTLNQLRSKKLNLPEGIPVKISVDSKLKDKTYKYALTLKGSEWATAQDKNIKLASRLINQMVEELRNLKGEEVVSETKAPEELKKNGFQSPSVVFNFEFPNPEGADKPTLPAEVKFSAVNGEKVYFLGSTNEAIYRIGKGHLDTLVRSLDALRDPKQPFLFETAKVAKLRFVSPDFKNGLELIKNNDKWGLVSGDATKAVNEPVVVDFINNVQGLEAATFLKTAEKAAAHEYSIELKDATGATALKIEFGGLYKDPKNNQEYYVVKSSLIDKLLAVRKPSMDKLVKPNLVQEASKPANVSEVKKVEQSPRSEVPNVAPGKVAPAAASEKPHEGP